MRCLLIVAHGSRMPETNDEIKRLTDGVHRRIGGRYDSVTYAFLEFAEPSFEDGLQACIDGGADEIVVLPYLLSVGRHVKRDIPEIVESKKAKHPGVTFRVAPYVGSAEGMLNLLLSLLP